MVEHKVGTEEKRLRTTEGRDTVCRPESIVGGKRRTRPRRLLSKGVRVYFHHTDGVRTRASFNNQLPSSKRWYKLGYGTSLAAGYSMRFKVLAIGSEEGAMTIHIQRPWPSTVSPAEAILSGI